MIMCTQCTSIVCSIVRAPVGYMHVLDFSSSKLRSINTGHFNLKCAQMLASYPGLIPAFSTHARKNGKAWLILVTQWTWFMVTCNGMHNYCPGRVPLKDREAVLKVCSGPRYWHRVFLLTIVRCVDGRS